MDNIREDLHYKSKNSCKNKKEKKRFVIKTKTKDVSDDKPIVPSSCDLRSNIKVIEYNCLCEKNIAYSNVKQNNSTFTRIINNPVLNLVLKLVPSLCEYYDINKKQLNKLNKDSFIVYNKPDSYMDGRLNIIPQFICFSWIVKFATEIGFIDFNKMIESKKIEIITSIFNYTNAEIYNKDDVNFITSLKQININNIVKHLNYSIYSVPEFFISELEFVDYYIPFKYESVNIDDINLKGLNCISGGDMEYKSNHKVCSNKSRTYIKKYDATICTIFENGKDLAPIKFPINHGIQVGGSDIIINNLQLDISSNTRSSLLQQYKNGTKLCLRTNMELYVDFDDLYDMIVERILQDEEDISSLEDIKSKVKEEFKNFGIPISDDVNQKEIDMVDLKATRISLRPIGLKDLIVPLGKSKIDSIPHHLISNIEIISIMSLYGDHTTKIILVAENNFDKKSLYKFKPNSENSNLWYPSSQIKIKSFEGETSLKLITHFNTTILNENYSTLIVYYSHSVEDLY